MKNKYRLSVLSVALVMALSGNALAAKHSKKSKQTAKPASTAPAAPLINDYPTRDRIEYVLNCIAQKDGNLSKMNYVTQYACGCKIDKIAEKLSFADYEAAKTFNYLGKGQTGDAGGVFRDPAQAKDLKTRIKEAEEYGQKSCVVK
ncbi:MAG: hypothetical protein EXR80_10785 [Methylococcales bacterium]|nr:hypothetical protein [Methylococcales bacterium]